LAGWTFAFGDYYVLNIPQDVDNPNINKMAEIIDPYSKLSLFIFVIDVYTFVCRLFGSI
jgi:PhoPQ-activated pathogenicity-related protein